MAAMAGATLADLQQRLGHSSVNAALRYQHAAQGRDRQIAEALSRMSAVWGARLVCGPWQASRVVLEPVPEHCCGNPSRRP
jgi:hypothetical protein